MSTALKQGNTKDISKELVMNVIDSIQNSSKSEINDRISHLKQKLDLELNSVYFIAKRVTKYLDL